MKGDVVVKTNNYVKQQVKEAQEMKNKRKQKFAQAVIGSGIILLVVSTAINVVNMVLLFGIK